MKIRTLPVLPDRNEGGMAAEYCVGTRVEQSHTSIVPGARSPCRRSPAPLQSAGQVTSVPWSGGTGSQSLASVAQTGRAPACVL